MNFFIGYNLGKNKNSEESNGDFKAKEKMEMEEGKGMSGASAICGI